MLTSVEISPLLLLSLNSRASSFGESQYPMMLPSTNTFAPESLRVSLASNTGATPLLNNRCFILSAFTPTEMQADNARFFTNPQFEPSGVSFGQRRPQGVACKSLASKFGWLLLRGDCSLRKWLSVDMWFVLSSSWVMPTLPLPQFPVASACWNLSVIMPGRTAADTVIIGPFTPLRSSWYFMSRVKFLKETRKRSARRGPPSLKRLFLKWSLSSGCLLPSLSWITRYA